MNGVPDKPRRFVRRADARRVLAEVAGQPELIADFVEEAVAALEIVLRNLSDKADDRCVHPERRQQRRGRC